MSNRDYLLLIYMYMYVYNTISDDNFQSHQIRMHSAGLGMAWNRYGLFCNSRQTKYV